MTSIPTPENYFRRPAAEWGGAFDLPEPMPAPVAEKHAIHQAAHAAYVDASATWAAYAEAHPKPADEDLDALADALNSDRPVPTETVVGELIHLHDEARLAARRLDRARIDLARSIVEHRDAYLAGLVEGVDHDVAAYGTAIDTLEHLAQHLGTRAAAVDFIRTFDETAFEWVTFEMRSRRFRIVRGGLPTLVDMDLETDVLPHLHADRDAMRATFGTLEDTTDEPVDEVADLDDLAGLEDDDEADESAGDAE